jgi:predicted DNA-binding transcriptional regulator AlpA
MGEVLDVDELGDANAIAKLLGVSRPRVHQLAEEDPSFPPAVRQFGRMRVWHIPTVEAWRDRADIKARRSTPGRPKKVRPDPD